MVEKSAQEIIQSIIGATGYAEERKRSNQSASLRPVVTVSRTFGAGGTDIARALAEQLGVHFYDRDLLDEVVKAAKTDRHLLAKIDERVTSLMEDLIHSLLSPKALSKDDYLHHLVRVVLGIGHNGGVILGRGANSILVHQQVFRVRIEASLPRCVDRLVINQGLKKKKAEKLINKENEAHEKFAHKVAKMFPSDRFPFDLMINTDRYNQQHAVALILSAMKEAGFPTS